MYCDECGKNQASVHVARVVEGKKTEKHLCKECAVKNKIINENFSVKNIFPGLLTEGAYTYKVKNITCPVCGTSYNELRKSGKFGCSACYENFREIAIPFIGNIHGANHHRGKIPEKSRKVQDSISNIENLKIQLKEAVKKEEYEYAAELRDEIRKLESKLQEEQNG